MVRLCICIDCPIVTLVCILSDSVCLGSDFVPLHVCGLCVSFIGLTTHVDPSLLPDCANTSVTMSGLPVCLWSDRVSGSVCGWPVCKHPPFLSGLTVHGLTVCPLSAPIPTPLIPPSPLSTLGHDPATTSPAFPCGHSGAGRGDHSWIFWEPETQGLTHDYVAPVPVAMVRTRLGHGLGWVSKVDPAARASSLGLPGPGQSGEGAILGFGP